MSTRSVLAIAALAVTTSLSGPALVSPASASVGHTAGTATVTAKKHACTRTSSGKCIKGGEFCPKAKLHKSGWDAKGRRYVCKGSRTHPHWMKP